MGLFNFDKKKNQERQLENNQKTENLNGGVKETKIAQAEEYFGRLLKAFNDKNADIRFRKMGDEYIFYVDGTHHWIRFDITRPDTNSGILKAYLPLKEFAENVFNNAITKHDMLFHRWGIKNPNGDMPFGYFGLTEEQHNDLIAEIMFVLYKEWDLYNTALGDKSIINEYRTKRYYKDIAKINHLLDLLDDENNLVTVKADCVDKFFQLYIGQEKYPITNGCKYGLPLIQDNKLSKFTDITTLASSLVRAMCQDVNKDAGELGMERKVNRKMWRRDICAVTYCLIKELSLKPMSNTDIIAWLTYNTMKINNYKGNMSLTKNGNNLLITCGEYNISVASKTKPEVVDGFIVGYSSLREYAAKYLEDIITSVNINLSKLDTGVQLILDDARKEALIKALELLFKKELNLS
jgi:hypothetical protein